MRCHQPLQSSMRIPMQEFETLQIIVCSLIVAHRSSIRFAEISATVGSGGVRD